MSLTISKNFVVNKFHGCKTNVIAEKTGMKSIEMKKGTQKIRKLKKNKKN
jgi:hypothetical protein